MDGAVDVGLDLVAVAVLVVAAVTDLRARRIPDWLTLPALALAPVALLASGRFVEAGLSLAGAGACALVPLLLCSRRAAGGGDLKLCAAVGALLGPFPGMQAQLAAFVVVGAWCAIRFTWRGTATEVPFGPALLAGTLLALA